MTNGNPAAAVATASRTWGIILIVLGILCIAAPLVAGTFATMMIGVCVLAAGIATLMGAFQADSWGTGAFALMMGGLTLLAGAYMLAHPVLGLMTITLMLAFYFIFDGALQIVAAFKARPAPGWGMFLFGGILSLLLGYVIYAEWPISGGWVIGTLAGIRFLFGGMTMMMVGGAAAGVAKEMGGA